MSGTLRVKDWARFQHYRRRSPPWIKLHRSLLDNREYQQLKDGAARLLFDIWLIASESDGCVPFDSAALAWRLRKPIQVVRDSIQALIRAGFISSEGHDASSALALGLHDATPETEAERETEVEPEITTRPAARAETPPKTPSDTNGDLTFGSLMGLIRQKLYVPDGKPPADWEEARDGSILKQLRKHYKPRDIGIAIEGLALVRDHPGVFADEVDWLRKGSKVTLRALYHSSSGVLPMWSIATQAYWKHANSRVNRKDKNPPVAIGDALRKAMGTT
jgi:hypothetical protein